MRRILIEKEILDPKACSFGFPWKHDSICFNFNFPEECILKDDIKNITDKTDIETLVIGCRLESYDFISDMVNLKQLYIYDGEDVTNLGFIKNLLKLDQLYIVGSHIRDIEPLRILFKEKEKASAKEPDMFRRLGYMFSGIYVLKPTMISKIQKNYSIPLYAFLKSESAKKDYGDKGGKI